MKVSQVEQVQSQVVLSIEVEPSELEEHLDRVYRRAVQRVNIPGFRRGKAPKSVVERQLGRDAMVEDALETLLPQMTAGAIEEQSLDVVATPRVRVTQYEPLTIEATVPVRPDVDLGDYYQYRLEPESVEITPEAIDEVIEAMRRDAGAWEPVERVAELEDLVTMEVKGQVEDRVVMQDEGVEYVLTAGSTNPVPGFAEQLVGFNRDEEREFSLPFPEDYPQGDLAGKECSFTVTIKEIKERKLPDLDDEFAKSLNIEAETVVELRERLQEDMLNRNRRMADQSYQERAIQTLVDGTQVELPPLLVDHEIEHILSEQAEAMQRQQLKMEDYLSAVGKSLEQVQEELRPSAAERITRGLVMSALREKEGIEVTPEEVEEELNSMVGESATDSESLKQILDTESGRASISGILLNRKTMERLTSITRGEAATTPPSTAAAPAEEVQSQPEEGAQNV